MCESPRQNPLPGTVKAAAGASEQTISGQVTVHCTKLSHQVSLQPVKECCRLLQQAAFLWPSADVDRVTLSFGVWLFQRLLKHQWYTQYHPHIQYQVRPVLVQLHRNSFCNMCCCQVSVDSDLTNQSTPVKACTREDLI